MRGRGTRRGSIRLRRTRARRGRILVDGQSSGSIEVAKNTARASLIHVVGDLAAGATIEVNTIEGPVNAGGTIRVGPVVYLCCPPPPITFDGCIHIYDDAVIGTGGDLTGEIVVAGCHDPGDLNICIDGNDNGNVTLAQSGCPNQVDWSCQTCP